jgi:catechol 2,3-dioxygenase-like lactoylglutathione lyase family enzyme
MEISFIAGFGPVTRGEDARGFWGGALGLPLAEVAPGYWGAEDGRLPGAKAFALWPLADAAQAVFGTPEWPPGTPEPQAWIEFDVESPAAVAAAVTELEGTGRRVLSPAREEPWGQTTAHLLSPEGLLVGVTYTPWMHGADPLP